MRLSIPTAVCGLLLVVSCGGGSGTPAPASPPVDTYASLVAEADQLNFAAQEAGTEDFFDPALFPRSGGAQYDGVVTANLGRDGEFEVRSSIARI